MKRRKIAILGSGNIGCDLLMKVIADQSFSLELFAGIDPHSIGLKFARSHGVNASHDGISAVLRSGVELVFDATTSKAHLLHAPLLQKAGIYAIDLTPAAVGSYVVPSVNFNVINGNVNVNMITCGGQATIPMVYAVSRVAEIQYAEIVACIASKSAGIGTRENIDEFTQTTADAIKAVGGAKSSKAIIVLNPVEPPLLMTNTIYIKAAGAGKDQIIKSCTDMLHNVRQYVPGYRFRVPPLLDEEKITMVIEVEGAGDYLPKYSGNLDIITSAAVAVAKKVI